MFQDDINNQNSNQEELPTVANTESNTSSSTEKGGNIYPANDEPKSDDKGTPNDNPDSQSTKDADEGDSAGAKSNIKNDDDIYASSGYGIELLMYAIYEGALDVVRFLVDHGVDVNATYDDALTPKTYAGRIDFTCNCGAYSYRDDDGIMGWDAFRIGWYRYTPLMRAVVNCKNLDIVRFLIERGADVNARDYYGTTALIYSAFCGDSEVVRLLLDNGATVDSKEDGDRTAGNTALITAVVTGRFEVAKILLENGADPNERNYKHERPIDIARKRKQPGLVKLLIKYGAEE